jgi:dethiobiotin synthetase
MSGESKPTTEHPQLVLPAVVCITGTDTEVGKTITTAALAAALMKQGRTLAVYKPTQAGTENGLGDIDVVRELAGAQDVHEGIRLPYPMAPVASAQRAGAKLPTLGRHLKTIAQLSETHDHTLVEGAGGLLVALDRAGHTLADLAASPGLHTSAIVVCRSALGTLNHTELTLEALQRRKILIAGTVIGSWPAEPSDIEISNREYLGEHAIPLLGVIPAAAGRLSADQFRKQAPGWFGLANAG